MDLAVKKEIETIIASGKNFLFVTNKTPTIDSVAGALAFSQALQSLKKGTVVACASNLTVEASILFGVDKVATKTGNRNLVISLDYQEGSIEKVSYNVEGDKFNLIIQPKSGFPAFSTEKVNYSYSGLSADAIFIFGAQKIEDLGSIYEENRDNFKDIPIINIDCNPENSNFGKINLVDKESSCSEITTEIVKELGFMIDMDTASNLLSGIESATDSFQSKNTTAKDFEAAAFCLSKGARRLFKYVSQDQNNKQQVVAVEETVKEEVKIDKPQEKIKAPPDWLQPKIYRGGQLL